MWEQLLATGLGSLAIAAIAGFACGFLNTVASSGSAVSLPILMMIGLDPITANATNRLPVLIAGASASWSFHRSGNMPWDLVYKVSLPVTIGAVAGALAAEALPGRELGLVITGAVLVALLLIFTRIKKLLEAVTAADIRFGAREFLVFIGIGVWCGFIVLDSATYLLLALTLLVGAALVPANAIKNALMIPTSIVALTIFVWKGHINWEIGGVMAVGAIIGGLLGAKLAIAAGARKWIFRLLVLVMLGELIHLAVHYIHGTA
jgi:uncharacterized membrane protein YfcA